MPEVVSRRLGWYDKHVLPRLIQLACGLKPIMRQREKVVPLARGRVLEIGVGSGLNLPYYDARGVSKVYGLDPSPEMIALARRAARAVPFELELLNASAGGVPLADRSVDTVLVTYTLCSIAEAIPALREMRRVLQPGGRLIFCEHGAAPDARVRWWQDAVTPVWARFAGGCRLNRDIPGLLAAAGFAIESLETAYLPGWRPANFNYRGVATISP